MKRFISISLAVLLGLVSATELTQDTTFLQSETTTTTEKIDEVKEDLQKLYCLLYDDLTFFDLRKLERASDNLYQAYGTNVNGQGLSRQYTFNFCTRLETEKGDKTFGVTTEGLSANSNKVRLTGSGKPTYTETVITTTEEGDE